MTEVMEKQTWFQRWLDKHSPVYSYRCGHKILRVNSCYSGHYCSKCQLIIPETNVVSSNKGNEK